jgi:hypothetical protein
LRSVVATDARKAMLPVSAETNELAIASQVFRPPDMNPTLGQSTIDGNEDLQRSIVHGATWTD